MQIDVLNEVSGTTEDKVKAFNALQQDANPLRDIIGTRIKIQGFTVEAQEVERRGENETSPLITIITEDFSTYYTYSKGVYYSLKRLLAVFGSADEWEAPIPCTISSKENQNGRMYVLELG